MRIAYDPQIFYHQKHGGISRYFAELAKELTKQGEDVRVFAPIGHNAYLEGSGIDVKEASHLAKLYPHIPHRLRPADHSFVWPPIRSEIQSRIGSWKPNVVHETYYHGRKLYPSGIASAVTVYDMIHEIYPEAFPAGDSTRERKRRAVERADAILCISHSTARDLQKYLQVPESKISVTHLGWESLGRAGQRELPGLELEKPYFLYVGARSGYKNFHALLEAFADSRDLAGDFRIVAFGGGEFTKVELEKIAELGLEGKVFQSSGEDAELNFLYANARAFVYPSRYEGFGLPPLEAMAQDCPVVASNTSSMPEVIGDAALFFDPGEPEELTAALRRVAGSEEVRAQLVAKGRVRLLDFSWAKCAEDTLEVYRQIG